MAGEERTPLHQLGFREFAGTIQAVSTGDRLPVLGQAEEVMIFSVYLKAVDGQELPLEAQQFQYPDVLIKRMTERLGLNPAEYWDNIHVAELVALRSAYQAVVLDSSFARSLEGGRLPDHVQKDFELLSLGMEGHPYITDEIDRRRLMNQELAAAHTQAETAAGKPLTREIPEGVNTGVILAQSDAYTMQQYGDGKVVAHDNAHLGNRPQVGQAAVIVYYRGEGQVFGNSNNLEYSQPYLDPGTKDVAIIVKDMAANTSKAVLFDDLHDVEAFVEAQGLPSTTVMRARNLVASRPRLPARQRPEREPLYPPFVDKQTGALALEYREKGVKYTALFESTEAFQKVMQEFGIQPGSALAQEMLNYAEKNVPDHSKERASPLTHSQWDAEQAARIHADKVESPNLQNGRYSGPVVEVTQFHVVQDVGRGVAVVHDKMRLDKVPEAGQKMVVSYSNRRGKVDDRGRESGIGR